MRKIVISLFLALALVLVPASGGLAATTADVTVYATPSYVAITNAPASWTVNGVGGGNSRIAPSTTYYTNTAGDTTAPGDPVTAGQCYFTITNTSTVTTNIGLNFGDFSGGDTMTNGNTGSAGATTFGAYCWYEGLTYSTGKIVAKNDSTTVLKSSLAATTNQKWGLTLSTRTNAWTSGTQLQATVTLTATAAS